MLDELIFDYTRYKEKSFLEQLLRVSNTMFVVFAYWNLVRGWAVGNAAELGAPVLIVIMLLAAISGIVFGALLLIRFNLKTHALIFPFTAVACGATIEAGSLFRLAIIPGLAFVSLVLVRLIISAANTINRL